MNDWGAGLTELASLFLIVLLVYLLECFCWVSPHAHVFTLGLHGRSRRRHHGFAWNALDTAGVLANPFPPLTPLVVVAWPQFELTADAIHFPGNKGGPISIAWEKLQVTHSESRLVCNGQVAFKGSGLQVGQYLELLEQLQKARRGQREQIIQDWLRKTTSAQAASRRVKLFIGRSRWLRMIAIFQFVFLFLLVPLAFDRFGTRVLWQVILLLIGISIAILLEFWTLHRKIFPHAHDKDGRFKSAVTIVLSPVAAIRGCDVLTRDLLAGYHPLAAAGALLAAEEYQRFAAEQLRLCRFDDYLSKQYRAMLQTQVETTIRQQGIDPEELMRPPEIQIGCVVYCPRCLAQYTKERADCSDCGHEGMSMFREVNSSA
jgi:hypothetical protein